MRGQNNEAWLARWRDGACPVHGRGFVDDGAVTEAGFTPVKCSIEECTVRAARWATPDPHRASFGWCAGPDDIKALLVKAGDVDGDSEKAGKRGRVVRFSYALE